MNELMWLVVAVIAVTAVIKFGTHIERHRKQNADISQRSNQAVVPEENSVCSAYETGSMVYYASNKHRLRNNRYLFIYKKVNGSWRAYILRTPSFGDRDSSGYSTHRVWDGDKQYISWDGSVSTLKDMQTISRVWADCIQEYIATGKRFGQQ